MHRAEAGLAPTAALLMLLLKRELSLRGLSVHHAAPNAPGLMSYRAPRGSFSWLI